MNKTDDDLTAQEEAATLLPVDEHVEEISENGKKIRRRGVYLLPNLLTTGALFGGFYAILASQNQNFEAAAIAILVSMLLDGLDGRVARLTNTSSQFGVQYDSLADMVSFGVAPAIVAFNWGLLSLGKVGWAVGFAFTVCTALRLARFNAQAATSDNSVFTGLASPAAAGTVAAIVWVWHDIEVSASIASILSFVMVFLALLMVSNIQYNSFKGLDFKGRVPFIVMLMVVLAFAVVATHPAVMLLLTGIIYGSSGPLSWIWNRFK